MPDYKELYYALMRETESAIRILVRAQQHCEELLLMEEDNDGERELPSPPPPIQLFPHMEDAPPSTNSK